MTSERGHAELRGTPRQQLVFLNTHWGSKYTFAAPKSPAVRGRRRPPFDEHEELHGSSAAELLDEIRSHYRASRAERKAGGDQP